MQLVANKILRSELTVLEKYKSIKGYLERFTIVSIGRLHIRVHTILSEDKTPYLHSHPFFYMSIFLGGGYIEQLLVGDTIKELAHFAPKIILRSSSDFHRIKEVKKNTKTLFIAFYCNEWKLKKHTDIDMDNFHIPKESGLYEVDIEGIGRRYSRFDTFWYKENTNKSTAMSETKLSIYQVINNFKKVHI
jgi:hypothetical protein